MKPKTLMFRANGDANSYALIDADTGKWVLSLLVNGEMHAAEQIALLERVAQCWNTAAEFAGLPKRKLESLLSEGWQINGVSLQRTQEDGTVKHAACTTGGRVLWWQPEQARVIAPNVRSVMQQALEALGYAHATNQYESARQDRAIADLREALAMPQNQLDDINVADIAAQQDPVAHEWEMFAAYLIDKCEGEIISEEGLQRSMADMLADPQYAAPQPAPQQAAPNSVEIDGIKTGPVQQEPDRLHLAAMDLARKQADRIAELEQQLAARVPDDRNKRLREAFSQALGDTYVCGRVWDAWNYGTMTKDDFQPAGECPEVLDSLIAAAHAIPPENAPPKAPGTPE